MHINRHYQAKLSKYCDPQNCTAYYGQTLHYPRGPGDIHANKQSYRQTHTQTRSSQYSAPPMGWCKNHHFCALIQEVITKLYKTTHSMQDTKLASAIFWVHVKIINNFLSMPLQVPLACEILKSTIISLLWTYRKLGSKFTHFICTSLPLRIMRLLHLKQNNPKQFQNNVLS